MLAMLTITTVTTVTPVTPPRYVVAPANNVRPYTHLSGSGRFMLNAREGLHFCNTHPLYARVCQWIRICANRCGVYIAPSQSPLDGIPFSLANLLVSWFFFFSFCSSSASFLPSNNILNGAQTRQSPSGQRMHLHRHAETDRLAG